MLQGLKLIAGAIATIALTGACIGAGIIFGSLIISVARNPSLRAQLFSLAILAFGLTEAISLFALMISFLILFAL